MAELYETKLHAILDRLLVLRTSTRRRRPSDLWFDDDCRSAKRLCRTSTSIDALCVRRQCAEAAAASLLQTGHSEAWSVLAASHHTAKPDAKTNVAVDWQRTSWIEVSCPPTLLSAPPTSIVFWIKKVEDIRASTSGAANPVYSVQSHRVFPGFRHFQVSLQSLWMKSHPQYWSCQTSNASQTYTADSAAELACGWSGTVPKPLVQSVAAARRCSGST